jgi:hypothetical protein
LRSPDLRKVPSGAVLAAFALLLAGAGVFVVVLRCRAMYFAGTPLVGVEVRGEKHEGMDDVVLADFGTHVRQVDLQIAQELLLTRTMSGDAWRSGEVPPPSARRFHLSTEAWMYLWLYPGIAALAAILLLRRGRALPASEASPGP